MTVYEQAARAHQTPPLGPRSFTEDVEAHFMNGFVISRPDVFLLFRPVMRFARHEEIIDPWHRFPSTECDCWHLYLAAGNMAKAWDFMPWPLEWLSYESRNVLRFARIPRIRGLSRFAHRATP